MVSRRPSRAVKRGRQGVARMMDRPEWRQSADARRAAGDGSERPFDQCANGGSMMA